jgi:hypothetical protein
VIDRLAVFDFDECTSCAPYVFEVKYAVIEANLSVIAAYTLIEDEDLV